jgi:hypothetical protein
MLRNLFESFLFACKAIGAFFNILAFGVTALSDWSRGFAPVNKWFFVFFLPKMMIVAIGLIVTSIPWWILIGLSFLPTRVIGPIFFIAFIIMFKQ